MAITLGQVEAALEQALTLVSELAPLAALGGPAAGAIGAVVGKIAETADTLVTAVGNDASIIAGGDITKITALQAQLQAQNATLAAQIAAS
jgi:hypothetical protein